MRRKEEASKVIQTTRQSNTAHPRQSLFQRKIELPRVGLEPTTRHTLVIALLYHHFTIPSHQVSVETVETVSGVGVVVRLSLLVTNVVHNLVLPFPRNLMYENGEGRNMRRQLKIMEVIHVYIHVHVNLLRIHTWTHKLHAHTCHTCTHIHVYTHTHTNNTTIFFLSPPPTCTCIHVLLHTL